MRLDESRRCVGMRLLFHELARFSNPLFLSTSLKGAKPIVQYFPEPVGAAARGQEIVLEQPNRNAGAVVL